MSGDVELSDAAGAPVPGLGDVGGVGADRARGRLGPVVHERRRHRYPTFASYAGRQPRTRGGRRRWLAVALPVALAVGGCGDEGDDADDDGLVQEAEDLAESTGARALAEGMRSALIADDVGDDVDRRSVPVLQEAADNLPGTPDVSGIADADGDGRDDDGKVELRVDDEVACLTVARNEDVSVDDGAC